MVPASGPHDDDSWPQLPPGRAPPYTPRPSNKPPQSGLVSRSKDTTVTSMDPSRNNNESTDVGSRRATGSSMSGGRLSYSDILRTTSPERNDGAQDARPGAASGHQSRPKRPRTAERRTTAVTTSESSGHPTVAGRNSRDDQVRVHTVVVLTIIILTSNSPYRSLPLVKTAGNVMLRSPYYPPIHPVYPSPLGITFLRHPGHETCHLREDHKIRAAMRPLVFKQQKDQGERSNLPTISLTHLVPIKLTPLLPSGRLLNPLPLLRHFQTNRASPCLRHYLTRPQPWQRQCPAACHHIVVCLWVRSTRCLG